MKWLVLTVLLAFACVAPAAIARTNDAAGDQVLSPDVASAAASLIDRPHLAVTRTLLDPGKATTVWTGFYSDSIEKHIAQLQAQSGLTVAAPEQDVFLDGAHGQIISWLVTADAPLRPGRYTMTLWVDGAQVDTIAIDVRPSCCWVWLPWVRKT